jgi:hypothetical protein
MNQLLGVLHVLAGIVFIVGGVFLLYAVVAVGFELLRIFSRWLQQH